MAAFRALGLAAASALALGPAPLQAQELRIGFVTTMTGGGALIGDPMRKGWDLALEHLGGKFGGLSPKISYGDDQMKPDVAINVVDKFLSQDKVHFVVGPPWTNLMLAVKDRVLASSAILMSPISGPSQLAGKDCSPYFFALSWQSDQIPEATAQILNEGKVDNVYLLAPNYQAGKDVVRASSASSRARSSARACSSSACPTSRPKSRRCARRTPPPSPCSRRAAWAWRS